MSCIGLKWVSLLPILLVIACGPHRQQCEFGGDSPLKPRQALKGPTVEVRVLIAFLVPRRQDHLYRESSAVDHLGVHHSMCKGEEHPRWILNFTVWEEDPGMIKYKRFAERMTVYWWEIVSGLENSVVALLNLNIFR